MKKREILKNYSRRNVIKGLGLTAAAPFIPVFNAEAQTGTPIKRFMVVTTPSGHGDEYNPSNPGRDYSLGPACSALEPHKGDINFYRGIDFSAWLKLLDDGRTFNVTNSHPALAPHLLTAAFTTRDNPNLGAGDQTAVYHSEGLSIDQYISQRFMDNAATRTVRPYIFGGVNTPNNNYYHQVYGMPGQSIYPQDKAPGLFTEVFDGATGGGAGGDEAFRRRLAERRSVIDNAMGEIERVSSIIATEDVYKMDAHLTALRELERQLEFQEQSGSLSCTLPELQDNEIQGLVADERYRINGENMMDIIVQGFTCDLSRVATLMWSGAADNTVFTEKDLNRGHHSYTHGGIMDQPQVNGRNKASEWYAERFAYLLSKMKSIPDGNGGSLLDSTLIIWTTEHSNETREHDRTNIPYVTAGSCGGAMTTGEFFDFSNNRRGHGDIYVTAAHALGFTDLNSFGIPEACPTQGPLPGVLA